ncbi:MAG: hypothetical protein JW891_12605 [Candidatus Lokiarchaeota archaeon]|nr:hypothetical protein [Candidatus Lokiarchaeota archaeon]
MIKCKIINSLSYSKQEALINGFFAEHPNIKIIYSKYDGRFFCLYEE